MPNWLVEIGSLVTWSELVANYKQRKAVRKLMKTQRRWFGNFVWLSVTVLLATQVAVLGAVLKNRWSFNETEGTTAQDSVGGMHGTLNGPNASFQPNVGADGSGVVMLWNGGPGQSIGSSNGCDYVAFPPNIVTGYTAITVEAWVWPYFHNAPYADWNRVWDFGNRTHIDPQNGLWASTNYFFLRAGSDQYAAGGAIQTSNGVWQGQYPSTFRPTGESWNHYVWCSDGTRGKLKMYLNGQLVGDFDGFTVTPAMVGPTTNNWLARSQFEVDRALSCLIDEFRIYDGMLNPLEVAANYQKGPSTYPASYGTITNLVLQTDATIPIGGVRPVYLWAYASGLDNNPYNISDVDGVTYVTGDTNVLVVDRDGYALGVSEGTTTVAASFGGIWAPTQTVSVAYVPPRLKHRYSFNDGTANDSIGGAHGTFYNGSGQSSISGGQLNLVNPAGSRDDYVELPPYILDITNVINGALTFVMWVTIPPNSNAWMRIFDFGTEYGGDGGNYIFFTPNISAGMLGPSRAATSDTSPGWMSEDIVNGPNFMGQTNAHIVVVWNPRPGRQFFAIYVNGVLGGYATTTKPYRLLRNVRSYLGRSLYAADVGLAGSINEFRIYDGELDRMQIAASYVYGPESTNLAVGNFVSFELNRGEPTLALDQVRQASCIINFEYATNVNVIGDTTLWLSSSDTNVVTITSPGGLIRAVGLGTATLTAVYAYGTYGATNYYTNSTTITVVLPEPAQLVHRYTFNQTSGLIVTDVVGNAHGVIRAATNELGITNFAWGTGTVAGQLAINTNGAQPMDTYIELPAGIISALTNNATFEVWIDPRRVEYAANWQRIFDFGGELPQPYIFLTRRYSTANLPRFDWQTGYIDSTTPLLLGSHHIVILYDDADDSVVMYHNGARVAQSGAVGLSLASINDTNNWLGRSRFVADPYFRGGYNEFRIYSGLLTEAEIKRNYALGPDRLITNAPLYFSVSATNLILSWPNYAARFTLESTPILGPGASWSPVPAAITQSGTNYQVSIPIGSGTQFFRLRKSGW